MKAIAQLIVLVTLLIVLLGALMYVTINSQWLHTSSSPQLLNSFSSPEHGITFQYPASFQMTDLTEDSVKIGMFFRATRGRTLLTIRRESGLGVLKLIGGGVVEQLKSGVNRQYPKRYPDFAKVSMDDRTIGGEPGFVTDFTYHGKDSTTLVRQLLAVVLARDSDGYFLSIQAPDADFAAVRVDFEQILQTIKFSEPTEKHSPPRPTSPQ